MAPRRVWLGPRLLRTRHKSLRGGRGSVNPSKHSSPAAAFEHPGQVWGGKELISGDAKAHFAEPILWDTALLSAL